MACPPGLSEGCRFRRFPASPSAPVRPAGRLRKALPTERKLALFLTCTIWTLLAAIAEMTRLAMPIALHL
jgi:hypothetical protein